ncbi:MAG: leucine-rich repeat protein [Gudongella sp.]|nr:leucine-rich repeat protein [Gudongella sp.]
MDISNRIISVGLVAFLLLTCIPGTLLLDTGDDVDGDSSDSGYNEVIVSLGGSSSSEGGGLSGITIGDFSYVIEGGSAAVTGWSGSGAMSIPASVVSEDQTYDVTSIGSEAFYKNTGITSVTIPDSVKNIGSRAFSNCTGMITVTFGSGLQTIETYAFNYCNKLTTVNYSPNSSLTTIGEKAFWLCTAYTGISIPDSVISIGASAFATTSISGGGSPASGTVYVGSGVETIGQSAFLRSGLTSISVSGQNSHFESAEGVLYGVADGAKTTLIQCPSGKTGSLTIGNTVTEIEEGAFYLSQLTSVMFQDGSALERVGSSAFKSSNMTSITIPSKVTVIEDYAFYGGKLATVTFADSDKSEDGLYIAANSFEQCPLTEVIFGSLKITYIGSKAFYTEPSKITRFGSEEGKILIPSTVVQIGESAFYRPDVSEISFGENCSIESVGNHAFDLWGASTNAVLDLSNCGSLQTVGEYAFRANTGIVSATLTLSPSLLTIEEYSFYGMASAEISIPDSVIVIGDYAFSGDVGKRPGSIVFGESPSLESLGTRSLCGSGELDLDLGGCTKLRFIGRSLGVGLSSVTLPAGIVVDSDLNAISYYDSNDTQQYPLSISRVLEDDTLTINSDTKVINLFDLTYKSNNKSWDVRALTSITGEGNDSFEVVDGVLYLKVSETERHLIKAYGGITSISIPSNVTKICSFAFACCTGLTSVILLGESTIVEEDAFYGCTSLDVFITSTSPELISAGAFAGLDSVHFFSPNTSDFSAEDFNCLGSYSKGLSVNGFNVYVASDIDCSVTVSDETFVFGFEDGYSHHDVEVKVSDSTILFDGGYYIHISGDTLIKIAQKERIGAGNTVTFVLTNGEFVDGSKQYTYTLPSGLSVVEDEIPSAVYNKHSVTWYDVSTDAPYDFDTAVVSDLSLYGTWVERNPSIEFSSEHGGITVTTSEGSLVSGSLLSSGTEVNLAFKDESNWDFNSWIVKVNGEETRWLSRSYTITITDDTYVSAICTYYSASDHLSSIISMDTPTTSEMGEVVLGWNTNNTVDTSNMSYWLGHSSVPLVVGDYVYVRASDTLYKIESDTGYIVNSSATSESTTAYYHYLGYGGGYICDYTTGIVYDLDLNPVYILPEGVTSVSYHEGMFYGRLGNSLKIFSCEDEDTTKPDEVKTGTFISLGNELGSNYGTFAQPSFVDGYAYYIASSGNDRMLTSVSLASGTKVSEVTLAGITGHLLDDGWLSYYEGRLYLTSYTVGLFGAVSASGVSTITSVAINEGQFSDVKYTEVNAGGRVIKSLMSEFVIFEGRGYLLASASVDEGYFMVYDVSSDGILSLAYYEKCLGSHGSIVVDTTDATERNGNKVTVYVIPYSSSCYIYTFSDANYKTSAESVRIQINENLRQYNSQAIRAGLNGQLIWYNDGGRVISYASPEKNPYYFFIVDGNKAKWVECYGSDAASAIIDSGYAIVSSNTITSASITGKDADFKVGWNLYALVSDSMFEYAWEEVASMANTRYSISHYYILTTDSSLDYIDGSTWSYGDDLKYSFIKNIGDRSMVGICLTGNAPTYTVTYDAGEGSYTESPTTSGIVSGTSHTISPIVPNRDGYVFSGYADEPEGNVVYAYENGGFTPASVTSSGDISLYAVWIDDTIGTIHYQTFLGGENVSNIKTSNNLPRISPMQNVNEVEVYLGMKVEVGYAAPTSTYYKTAPDSLPSGWNWSDSGYAVWTIVTPDLNLDAGVSFSVLYNNNPATATWSNLVLAVPESTDDVTTSKGQVTLVSSIDGKSLDGYVIKAWNTEEDLTGTSYPVGSTYDLQSDVTLYAEWAALYTVTYVLDGGSGDAPMQSPLAEGAKFKTASYDGTKDGCTFNGWNDGTNTYAAGAEYTVETSNVTLTAVWTAVVEYSVCCTPTTSGGNTVLDLGVSRESGDANVANARFLVIAEYSGGIFLNVYSKIDLKEDGTATEKVYVSTGGLKNISVQIVSGIPSGTSFDQYGIYQYSVMV